MPSNKKQQRGQKIDASKFFADANKDQDLEWAHSKNYEQEAASSPATTTDSKAKQQNSIQITKAASFGNFRDEGPRKTAGVPDDMQAPFVAFVKTFGRQMTEEAMATFFPDSQIDHIILINCEKALFCFIEFHTREDLARALLVSGAKMKYQHPCTVDVASPSQIEKFVADKIKKQQQAERRLRRQAGSRNAARNSATTPYSEDGEECSTTSARSSATATPFNFDRNSIFGTQQQPPASEDLSLANAATASPASPSPSSTTTRTPQNQKPPRHVNFDDGRSFFNSATPISAGDIQKLENHQKEGTASGGDLSSVVPPRFSRNNNNQHHHHKKNSSSAEFDRTSSCSKFSEFSRSELFGTASAPQSPQTGSGGGVEGGSATSLKSPQFSFNQHHLARFGGNSAARSNNNNTQNNHHQHQGYKSTESLSGRTAFTSSCSSPATSSAASSCGDFNDDQKTQDKKKKYNTKKLPNATLDQEEVSRDALFGSVVTVAKTDDTQQTEPPTPTGTTSSQQTPTSTSSTSRAPPPFSSSHTTSSPNFNDKNNNTKKKMFTFSNTTTATAASPQKSPNTKMMNAPPPSFGEYSTSSNQQQKQRVPSYSSQHQPLTEGNDRFGSLSAGSRNQVGASSSSSASKSNWRS